MEERRTEVRRTTVVPDPATPLEGQTNVNVNVDGDGRTTVTHDPPAETVRETTTMECRPIR